MKARVLPIVLVLLALSATAVYATATDRWAPVVEEIGQTIEGALKLHAEGDTRRAGAELSRAYFELFEESGMEDAVAQSISTARKTELERGFAHLREAIKLAMPAEVVRERADSLMAKLRADAQRLSATGAGSKGSYGTFLSALMIILREGFEAILIIGALVAYLVKTGRQDKTRFIYYGAGAALLASLLTAVLLHSVINLSGAAQEAIEGLTMLMATAVLFYVSYWLISKMEAERWHHYIKSRVDEALGRTSLFALSMAAFLAVYREGAETILFYQALYSGSGKGGQILAGFVTGSLGLVVVFWLIRRYSIRIPIKPFFAVTSALLYYLAFSFAGKGVMELQEAGWLPYTEIGWLPQVELFGIYPSKEGLLLQGLMLAALMAAMAYWLATRRGREGRVDGI